MTMITNSSSVPQQDLEPLLRLGAQAGERTGRGSETMVQLVGGARVQLTQEGEDGRGRHGPDLAEFDRPRRQERRQVAPDVTLALDVHAGRLQSAGLLEEPQGGTRDRTPVRLERDRSVRREPWAEALRSTGGKNCEEQREQGAATPRARC